MSNQILKEERNVDKSVKWIPVIFIENQMIVGLMKER
jgi:hypothetical protein